MTKCLVEIEDSRLNTSIEVIQAIQGLNKAETIIYLVKLGVEAYKARQKETEKLEKATSIEPKIEKTEGERWLGAKPSTKTAKEPVEVINI